MFSKITMNLIVISLISFSQGIAGLSDIAITYLYKDEFHLSPAVVASLTSFTYLPFSFKVVFGFISDSFPICGYRRKPYWFILTLTTIVSWTALAFLPINIYLVVFYICLFQISSAFNSVIAEALVIETSRAQASKGENKTSQNVFIFFFIRSFGYLLTSFSSGALLEVISKRSIFLISACFPVLIWIASLFLPETKAGNIKQDVISLWTHRQQLTSLLGFYNKYELSLYDHTSITSNLKTTLWTNIKEQVKLIFNIIKISKIRKAAFFWFIYSATPGYGWIMFFYYTDVWKFNPLKMGNLKMVYGIAIMLGMCVFNFCWKTIKFRKIMISSILWSIAFNGWYIMLLKRVSINVLNIPDFIFVIITETLVNSTNEIMTMPILIWVCNWCPNKIEGTWYAMFMGIMNIGYIFATQEGALLSKVFGIKGDNYDNLDKCIYVTFGYLGFIIWWTLFINEREYKTVIEVNTQSLSKSKSKSFLIARGTVKEMRLTNGSDDEMRCGGNNRGFSF